MSLNVWRRSIVGGVNKQNSIINIWLCKWLDSRRKCDHCCRFSFHTISNLQTVLQLFFFRGGGGRGYSAQLKPGISDNSFGEGKYPVDFEPKFQPPSQLCITDSLLHTMYVETNKYYLILIEIPIDFNAFLFLHCPMRRFRFILCNRQCLWYHFVTVLLSVFINFSTRPTWHLFHFNLVLLNCICGNQLFLRTFIIVTFTSLLILKIAIYKENYGVNLDPWN